MVHLMCVCVAAGMVVLACADVGAGEAAALAPWAGNTRASDQRKTHVEDISAGRHTYAIRQGGTLDGQNCASPMGCGMSKEGVREQTWESNRSVRLENVGDTDVVNPWLSNGRNNFRTVGEIVAAAVTEDMSPAEKAFALWWQETRYRYHFSGGVYNEDLCDVVKVFNTYGHNTCGNDSICLATLWRHAGLKAAPGHAVLHCISQAFYDQAWHLFDGDMHAVYLLRDNATVASEQDLMRDHALIKRSHTQGILFPDNRSADEVTAAMYLYEGPVKGTRGRDTDTTMNLTLRPGEALVWRWGHLTPPKIQGGGKPTYPDAICNGLLEYRPDFTRAVWRQGADRVENVQAGPDGLGAEPGKTGTVVWSLRCPYVFVGGRLQCDGTGATFSLSFDGKPWHSVTDSLDPLLAKKGPGRYAYQLRCELKGEARLKRLLIVNDVQMAPLALPGMVVGENRFTYTDTSPGKRQVRVTHVWVERSASKAPPPPKAVTPVDGGESDGTGIVFRWAPPVDPDGDRIKDYHFELSSRADMRWPLSMTFAKLISRTADKGKAQYTLPQAGLLTPGTQYYWRVRAQDAAGVWGPWSRTWHFTARGPAHPVAVAVDFDKATGTGTLRWKPSPVGSEAVKYRVYGSDEKGFSVSDVPYTFVQQVQVDRGTFDKRFAIAPVNLIAETAATRLVVLGPNATSDAGNKTFYRVVAVDGQGRRSGPSDYAQAPRPVIYTRPVTAAKKGEAYTYAVKANRSLGDLRLNAKKTGGFWNSETFKYALKSGPAWLKIDPGTGVLSGTPDGAGEFEIAVSTVLERPVQKPDESALKWGSLKIQTEETEILGPAMQTFVLTVVD